MTFLPSYVNGSWWTPADDPDAAIVRDASTGDEIVRVSTKGLDLAAAVAYARREGRASLGALTFPERAMVLKNLAIALNERRDELYALSERSGSTRRDSLSDIDGGIGVLFTFSSKARRELPAGTVVLDGPIEPLSKDGSFLGRHVYTRLSGVAVQINAFNFPMWGALEKFAPAFLAGLPTIVKPATPTAYIAEAWVRMVVETGLLPEGSLQLVSGSVPGLFDLLDLGDTVGFTGSASTAERLRARAKPGVRFTSETDSINASILGPDAVPGTPEFDAYVKQLLVELTTKAGQKCTAIRRAIVPTGTTDAVARALRDRIAERVVIGDPRVEGVTMGPVVSVEQRDEVLRQVRALTDAGGRFVVGSADVPRGVPAEGAFLQPMLLAFADAATPAVNDIEAFGPVASIVEYADVAEAATIVSRGGGSLVTSVATHDPDVATELLTRMGAMNGRVLFLDRDDARTSTGHGAPVPHLVHGGPVAPAAAKSSAASARSCTPCSAPRSRARPACSPRSPACGIREPTPIPRVRTLSASPCRSFGSGMPWNRPSARSLSTTSRSSRTSPATRSTRTWTRSRPRPTPSSRGGSRTATCSCRGRRDCSSTRRRAGARQLGLENLRFVTPVSPGDRIRVALTAKQITPRETDDYGEVRWDAVIRNQHDEIVAQYDVLTLVAKTWAPVAVPA